MEKRKINGRALTSLASTGGFLIMGVTGIILFLVPQGRIAYWTDWHLWGLSKVQWGAIHTLGMFLFLTAGGFHVWFNWRPLVKYFTGRAASGLKHGRELLIAGLISVLIVISGITPFPPLGWLLDFNDLVKDSWVTAPEFEPPFGHAEEVSLRTLAAKTDVPLTAALAELKEQGVKVPSAQMKVLDLARLNNTSPMALWALVSHLEQPTVAAPADRVWTAEKVEQTFAGTGIGNKTLKDIAAKTGQTPKAMAARLKAAGMEMKPGELVKQAAGRLDVNPLEMLKAALVDGYRPQ